MNNIFLQSKEVKQNENSFTSSRANSQRNDFATLIPLLFKFIIVCFLLITECLRVNSAPVMRALIVGINTYSPPKDVSNVKQNAKAFGDLDGCRNDALSVKSLLELRFHFSSSEIDTLLNRNATRKNILDHLNTLLRESRDGDVVFFYYAGHGSQQKNSASPENDKQDETIVPADR